MKQARVCGLLRAMEIKRAAQMQMQSYVRAHPPQVGRRASCLGGLSRWACYSPQPAAGRRAQGYNGRSQVTSYGYREQGPGGPAAVLQLQRLLVGPGNG